MTPSTHPLFWRDSSLPFVELRQVLVGQNVSYATHSHKEWSIGAILGGESEFLCAKRQYSVKCGDIVMMDPEVAHACNPLPDSPWAYYMIHIDVDWLVNVLHSTEIIKNKHFQPTNVDTLTSLTLYNGLIDLAQTLMHNTRQISNEEKEARLKTYLIELFQHLYGQETLSTVKAVANNSSTTTFLDIATYLDTHYLEDISIEQLSHQFNLSTSYLIRSFKQHFNMSPHAYRINQRVLHGQRALKSGLPITDVAHEVGFNDQAHFQRAFKQRVAATPKQYINTKTL
ncbi:AraC family transcriptional regulator [Marinomonas sp. 2405UD68-3]|uniref:AraC family transcriptional regulator n=1 Tax=Marinomonas sp. 2405UD68-3 TaxID=3391835 RepID=UPI0039C9F88F